MRRFSFTPALRRLSFLSAVAVLVGGSSAVHGSITGFGDFSGFKLNQGDSNSPPTIPSAGTIQITNNGGEFRSLFATTPQTISGFSASFVISANTIDTDSSAGITFVIQNDARGASAVSTTQYFQGFYGIGNSVGITLNMARNTTGYFVNGPDTTSASTTVNPVLMRSSDPIKVELAYNGSTLKETLTDLTTLVTGNTTFFLSTPIETTVGGNTAYVGFTAGSSGSVANLFISNFQFSAASVPEPANALLAVPLGALVLRKRR